MIRMQKVMTIARAETRLTRRLVRYWFFLALSYFIAVIFFLFYSGFHSAFSSYSATAGLFNPRFLVSVIGLYYLLVYMAGTVFLGFDVRNRDQRKRMTEVLDSRPHTNLELVSGRFLGLFFSSWVPIAVMAIILELLGLLLAELGTPFGGTIEIWSLLAFVFLMALPALAFVLSLVFLLALLIRNRLMAAVVLLVLVGGDFWAIFKIPEARRWLVFHRGYTESNLTIFKPGYGVFPSHRDSKAVRENKTWPPPDKYAVYELPKLKTRDERKENMIFEHHLEIPYQKRKRLLNLINEECRYLGFTPYSIPEEEKQQ